MSNPRNRHPQNISGPWYCTHPEDPSGEGCIACNICYSGAPEFFAEDDDGYAYVYRQPETEDDRELCREQLESCPVMSIGDDGEEKAATSAAATSG